MITMQLTDSEYYPESPKRVEIRDLANISDAVHELRMSLLFQLTSDGNGLGRYAEQHFLAGLAILEQAERTFRVAWMEQLDNR